MIKLCRFQTERRQPRVGVVLDDDTVVDLSAAGVTEMRPLLEAEMPSADLAKILSEPPTRTPLGEVQLLTPVERQEVWAAGVTYLRSKTARMEESNFSANAYDQVYDAERPELFFKSLPEKVVSPGEPVGIRKDAVWNVPEPELALVVNSKGKIVGYSIGNDMSSRDIEGANLLYLPQAKIYHRSCAIGPWFLLGPEEKEAREWDVKVEVRREGAAIFSGATSIGRMKRSFQELVDCLFRSQVFPSGAVLLTGTGIVPDEKFTLQPGDLIQMSISGIGSMENAVVAV